MNPTVSIRNLSECFRIRFPDDSSLEVHRNSDPVESVALAAARRARQSQVIWSRCWVLLALDVILLTALLLPSRSSDRNGVLWFLASIGGVSGFCIYSLHRLGQADERYEQAWWQDARPRRVSLGTTERADLEATEKLLSGRLRNGMWIQAGIAVGAAGILLLLLAIQWYERRWGAFVTVPCQLAELGVGITTFYLLARSMAGQERAARDHREQLWRLAAPHLERLDVTCDA